MGMYAVGYRYIGKGRPEDIEGCTEAGQETQGCEPHKWRLRGHNLNDPGLRAGVTAAGRCGRNHGSRTGRGAGCSPFDCWGDVSNG